MNLVLFIDNL